MDLFRKLTIGIGISFSGSDDPSGKAGWYATEKFTIPTGAGK